MITREKKTKYDKKYYLKNKDKALTQAKNYYLKNKDKVVKRSAVWNKNNPEKALKSKQNWKKNNPNKILAYKLKHKFGITLEAYYNLFAEQKNCCAICGKDQVMMFRKLHLDHDHKTGKVRGLLCKNCNHGLGFFDDDIKTLLSAVKYLTKKR